MKKRYFWLLLSFATAGFALVLLLNLSPRPAAGASPPSPATEKIAPDLLDQVTEGHSPHRILLYLTSEPTPQALPLPDDKVGRRAAVVSYLRQHAATTQAPVLAELERLAHAGRVTSYSPLWITNAVVVTGTREAIFELAARPDIRYLQADQSLRLDWEEPEELPSNPESDLPMPWGLLHSRAPHVWHALNVTGENITVGIMDSGVDWLHPALNASYRGTLGTGSVVHAGNWFDATDWSNVSPRDPYGHGTHVAGTVAGHIVGMAPNAEWIAVRVFDAMGFSTYSILHQGFQWLLAPMGDPSLAPDIVNGSWGAAGDEPEFMPDIAALQAAGIITVFSAGNNGHSGSTLVSPASYADPIAVGASDPRAQLAWFSSVGPSPLTLGIKPELVAPGAGVLSSLPDGHYGYANGTSMSAPHVAGAAALLLSANPALTPLQVKQVLTSTAAHFESPAPNPRTGWGELDVYAAVQSQLVVGRVRGTLTSNGAPLPGVTVTLTTPAGEQLIFVTDMTGAYDIGAQPGTYALTFAKFGYQATAVPAITLQPGTTVWRSVDMQALPAGNLVGLVTDAVSGGRLPAELRVLETPLAVTANVQGSYGLTLPAGNYTIEVHHTGHRLASQQVSITPGGTSTANFGLAPGPRLLLVDSGWWYYNSQADYYRRALGELDYAHDEWAVYNPLEDVPALSDLAGYDTVLWSAPSDSPGTLNAGDVISDYLSLGGNLFISGRNIGSLDGGLTPEAWWFVALRAMHVNQLRPVGVPPLYGEDQTPFAGLSLSLNGGDGAQNQHVVDQVAPVRNGFTVQALRYGPGQGAGLIRGHCTGPGFHVVYLGFGLEGVSSGAHRRLLMQRSFDYFNAPPLETGLSLTPGNEQLLAAPGQQITVSLALENQSELFTDTVQLSVDEGPWPSQFVSPTLTLGPCGRATTSLTLPVPESAPRDTSYTFTLRAASTNDPTFSIVRDIVVKTPGDVLVVDDHRFFAPTDTYQQGLQAAGLSPDVWVTGWGAGDGLGSPPLALLTAYDMVFWYTGYDWYEPVSRTELEILVEYLEGGGRLFLSSQDFLTRLRDREKASRYFGTLDFSESVTPTIAYGGAGTILGESPPISLTIVPYQNHADGLVPQEGAQPFLWHNGGGAAGLGFQGEAEETWRTAFWSIPLEELSIGQQAPALARVAGWLGDLGDSTFAVSRRTAAPGDTLAYTLTLRNASNGTPNLVTITNTLPAGLTLVPGTLSGGATYDPDAQTIGWQAELADGAEHVIAYAAVVESGLPSGQKLDNRVLVRYSRHGMVYPLDAVSWVNAPDLTGASLAAFPETVAPGKPVTYSVMLPNNSPAAASVSVTLTLPDALHVVTETIAHTGGSIISTGRHLYWVGTIPGESSAEFTFVASSTWAARNDWLPATLVIDDGVTFPIVRTHNLHPASHPNYLPNTRSQR